MTGGKLIAGIGCRRGATSHDIITLVRRALAAASGDGVILGALATPRFKADEAGLQDAATMLGVPLTLVDEAALIAVQSRCATRSLHAEATTGIASVAEGAALAAAGDNAILLLPRIAGSGVTCALAQASEAAP
jgi:cobalt-precorrin 5A hydrolase